MSDLREALSSAFEQAETEASPVEVENAPVAAAAQEPAPQEESAREATPSEFKSDESAAQAKARDEKGRFATKTSTPKASTPSQPLSVAATSLKDGKPAAQEASTVPPPASGPQVERAPQSWKPLAREKWAALPPEVQQEVDRRERETAVAMQESAEARKLEASFRQVVQPYQAMFGGQDPMQRIQGLLQIDHALQTAPQQHKAQMLAKIITNSGVPIEALDAALSGAAQPAQAQQAPQYRDPRVDDLLARLQQTEAQRTQALKEKSLQTVNEFASKAEFFEDVREEVADMLEVAARRGRELSLEEAYNRAVKLHPELSQVMAQREAAAAAEKAKASTLKARAAASSVRSAPTAASTGAQSGDSVRAALEAAMARQSGR
jgi:hypothetical protein